MQWLVGRAVNDSKHDPTSQGPTFKIKIIFGKGMILSFSFLPDNSLMGHKSFYNQAKNNTMTQRH